MTVYIVTYDLNKETKRPNIVDEVKKKPWAMLSESSYAIDTTETPQQVYNRFTKYLDANDALLVISLRQPYYGQTSDEVHAWLKQRLE